MPRFGIEEEFLFLDEHSLAPVSLAAGTRERITRLAPEARSRRST